MGCCREQALDRLRDIHRRLAARGLKDEAAETRTITARLEVAWQRADRIESRMPQRRAVKEHIKGAPDKVQELYEECMKDPPETAKGKEKSYCAAVAWDRYNKGQY
jgi:hypothetical protein